MHLVYYPYYTLLFVYTFGHTIPTSFIITECEGHPWVVHRHEDMRRHGQCYSFLDFCYNIMNSKYPGHPYLSESLLTL